MGKFIPWPKFNLGKRGIILLTLTVAISCNIILSYWMVLLQKSDFLAQEILSQSQTALNLLSQDVYLGDYRKVMERLVGEKWANGARAQKILFYDMTSQREITSNYRNIKLSCQKNTQNPYIIQDENYISCIPLNASLLAQVTFSASPFTILAQKQFLIILISNLVLAGLLIVIILISMNSYLNRFILLLNKTMAKGHIEQNIPNEFKASFNGIAKLSKTLEHLKVELTQSTKSALASEVYAKIIHNIKNPLENISITLPVFKNGFNQEADDTIRNSLQEIEISVKRALDDYRASKAANIYEIIEQARTEVNLRVVDKNISIIPIEASDTVKAYTHKLDPTDFKAAITNMLNNAVEFMPNGGQILIKMEYGEKLHISIIDEGTGIDESILSKIGTKGFTHNKENGNGLGFYSSRKDIESWGGSLSIQNRDDSTGARVDIIL